MGERVLAIRTDRLLLRDFRPEDLPAYAKLRAHPGSRRFSTEGDARPDRAGELLRLFIAWSEERPRLRYQLAVVLPAQEVIGSVGVRADPAPEGQGPFRRGLGPRRGGRGEGRRGAGLPHPRVGPATVGSRLRPRGGPRDDRVRVPGTRPAPGLRGDAGRERGGGPFSELRPEGVLGSAA